VKAALPAAAGETAFVVGGTKKTAKYEPFRWGSRNRAFYYALASSAEAVQENGRLSGALPGGAEQQF
jgi:hypothetical protein